jgi:hypothetical protein
MNCPKCKGLMAFECFEDSLGTVHSNFFVGWRCLACGKISDPMIDSHQKTRPLLVASKTRKRSLK